MGCTVSRMEAPCGYGCGCGAAPRWNRGRRREVVKGEDDGGCRRGIESRESVQVEKEDEGQKGQNERDDDIIWSPGSPSFRDYLFVGSFDSNDGKFKDAVDSACKNVDKSPPQEVKDSKKENAPAIQGRPAKGQTRWGWGCGMRGLRNLQSKISPTPILF